MSLEERIKVLSAWGMAIEAGSEELEKAKKLSSAYNKWFTIENIEFALDSIVQQYLVEQKLREWIFRYDIPGENKLPKTIALVMAGNIPLVGFHDLLCVLITGNKPQLKLSSKDKYLLPVLLDMLYEIEPHVKNDIEVVERLNTFDGVIATGSNNSARYFEYYFGKYPHIIRKNRNSVAVLTGKETAEEIKDLGEDIFRYFGLGCRNISKLYVPRDYDFEKLLKNLGQYEYVMDNEGYKHNYDYNRTLLLMNREDHHAGDFLMIKKDTRLASPIANLYYEEYETKDELNEKLEQQKESIQCVVTKADLNRETIPLGQSQIPALWNYADDVDTVEFLLKLSN